MHEPASPRVRPTHDGAGCTRPACTRTGCAGGFLTALDLACVFSVVHDRLDVDDEHMFRAGGELPESRLTVSAAGIERLEEAAARVLLAEPVDPHGWVMLVMALLEAELPHLVDPMWQAEIPWVVESAIDSVVRKLPCIAYAARQGLLVADCSTGPAEHVCATLAEHIMAALPRA